MHEPLKMSLLNESLKNVYVATLGGKILGVFSRPHLAGDCKAITCGYGHKTIETSWGWVLDTHQGIVEVRSFPLDPK